MKKLFIILAIFIFAITLSAEEESANKKTLLKKYMSVIKDGNRALDHADPQYIMIIMGDIKELLEEIHLFETHQSDNSDKDLKKIKKKLFIMREKLDGLAAPSEKYNNKQSKENSNKKEEV